MPTEAQHEKIKETNKKFQSELSTGKLSDNYNGWQIVAIFYSAVHIMGKTLHCAGYNDIEIKKHSKMFDAIAVDCVGLYSDYKSLYDMSRLARYEYHNFSPDDVSDAKETLKTLEGAAHIQREKIRKGKH